MQFVGTSQEAHGKLESEPDDADSLDEEERIGDFGHLVLLDLGTIRGRVEYFVMFELR